jgi:polysaccharide export outer membrane protein
MDIRRLLAPAALLTAAALSAAACGGAPPPPLTGPLRADSAAPLMLRPGDVVKIQVFGHDELDGEYPVDENYVLLLPIIGEIDVRDMSVVDLRRRIRAEFGQLYTQSYVSIIPLFRVAVLGEVARPGLYSVDPTMTIYDVLATAGGPSRDAQGSRTRLVRAGQAVQVPVDAEWLARATLRELGVRSGDQIIIPKKFLTSQDWWVVLTALNTGLVAYTILR